MVKNKKEKYIVAGNTEHGFDVKNYQIGNKNQKVTTLSSKTYQATLDKHEFKGEVLQLKQNRCTVLLNGNTYSFIISKEETLMLKKHSKKGSEASNLYLLKSPMPGKIIDVFAAKGTKIEKGEPLVVLEAMKMQNLLQTEESGTITAINVRVGENVLGDQILVEIKIE
jgi:Acetyl/propionyl-CoA carboxylase, alpha subunit